jgi:hypothetical protein
VLHQFDDFEFQAHRSIQELIQSCVNEEFALQVRAGRYEHAPNRFDERKGGYERNLTTTFGTSRIRIPRVRFNKVKIHYSLFEKYQRRQKKFDKTVVLAMLLGLSVRTQCKWSFIGDAVSHTTASKLIRTLEDGLAVFRTRKIEDKYKYLLLDGLWVKVKDGNKLKEKVILFILGITLDNKKEIVAFKLAKGETEEEVTVLLNDVYRRGLEGKYLKLIASDGAKGIRSAISMIYPYVKWQLCYVHKLRNLNMHIRHKINNRPRMMRQDNQSQLWQKGYIADMSGFTHDAIGIFAEAMKYVAAVSLSNHDGQVVLTTLSEGSLEKEPGTIKPLAPRVALQSAPKTTGGIDFRSFPIVIRSMDSLKANIKAIPQSSLQRINLTQEWSDIERLINSGITPSVERLKDYLAASCFKGKLDSDMEKIASCISDILRMEEERCGLTDPTLKDILVVLGSGRSGEELKIAFNGTI